MTSEYADPDLELMLRFQKGEERAFEELVKKHTAGVLNLVYRYLGDASRAEDVAQEIFIKVYRVRQKYEPRAKFTAWLYRIAVNHCLNEIRSRRSQPSTGIPIDDLRVEPSEDSPAAPLDRQELRKAVKAAVDALPKNQRMAVILARYADMSYEEIADAMGMSVGAIRSILFRAKETLKISLSKYVRESP